MTPPDLKPTERFSAHAGYYAACRPGYPDCVIEWLRREAGLASDSVVVDVGSGTGLSASLFLRHGHTVYGVEPNAAMRGAAEHSLRHYPGFHSVAAQAEATTLPDASAGVIVCASAFHWFDPAGARSEFQRLLAPGGFVVVMRNGRGGKASEFMRAYGAIFRRYAAPTGARHGRVGVVRDFFSGGEYRTAALEWSELLDFPALSGRILSYSTIPLPGAPGHPEMMCELREAFRRASENGRIRYHGEITLHAGRWK
jgi:SAM-dependent methyltransferase